MGLGFGFGFGYRNEEKRRKKQRPGNKGVILFIGKSFLCEDFGSFGFGQGFG